MHTRTVECVLKGNIGPDAIREAEQASIREFVTEHAHRLKGRVLDFGAGKPGTCREPQPYRALLTSATEYVPYDVGDQLSIMERFDSFLCTQVIHLSGPESISDIRARARPGAVLVMTYQTNWDEVEAGDFFRFTRAGMEALLEERGWRVETHVRRAEVKIGGFRFALGYGVVAVAV